MELRERIIDSEVKAHDFISEQVAKIKNQVGPEEKGIVALSGGVDSSVTTVLAYQALGNRLKIIFVENGLMREGEREQVVKFFSSIGIPVEVIETSERFFANLKGKILPREKRIAIRKTFYEEILSELAQAFGAKFVFQGTSLTDILATIPGKDKDEGAVQHNVLEQIGIDTLKEFGYRLVEPLRELRKPSIRKVAQTLGLPKSIWNRMPFPGPALAARILGEVTPEKVAIIRKATKIVEKELARTGAFQYFPVLLDGLVPSADRTKLGYAISIVCVNSTDAQSATPTLLFNKGLVHLMTIIRERIICQVPEIFRVCVDISTKPPAATEWV